MQERPIAESIDRNIEQARAVGITGTPTFIIGNAILVGAKPLAEMENAIAEARSAPATQEPANNSGAKGR